MKLRLIRIWFDGGSKGNPGKGYGSYEIDGGETLKHRAERQEFGDFLTCNQAEYLSLIAALKWLRHHVQASECRLEIFTDSTLVRGQVAGKWKCRVLHLQELRDQAVALLKPYADRALHWKPRKTNVERFGH